MVASFMTFDMFFCSKAGSMAKDSVWVGQRNSSGQGLGELHSALTQEGIQYSLEDHGFKNGVLFAFID